MANNSVIAADVVMSVRTNGTTNPFTSFVCETDSNINGQMEVTSTSTKCGSKTAAGSIATTLSGNGVVSTTPDTGQISYNELQAFFLGKTKLDFEYTDASNNVFNGGSGWLTQLGNQNPSSGGSTFSWTFTVDGDVTDTPTS